mgnify:CR=1 FL=1
MVSSKLESTSKIILSWLTMILDMCCARTARFNLRFSININQVMLSLLLKFLNHSKELTIFSILWKMSQNGLKLSELKPFHNLKIPYIYNQQQLNDYTERGIFFSEDALSKFFKNNCGVNNWIAINHVKWILTRY